MYGTLTFSLRTVASMGGAVQAMTTEEYRKMYENVVHMAKEKSNGAVNAIIGASTSVMWICPDKTMVPGVVLKWRGNWDSSL